MSFNVTLIHYPADTCLPEPWQGDWSPMPGLMIPGVPHRKVARAPIGTPIPEGCTPYVPPNPTDEQVALACSHIESLTKLTESSIQAEALQEEHDNAQHFLAWQLGVSHHLAFYAAWDIPNLDAAIYTLMAAEDLWKATLTTVVIRTSPSGYQAWRGVASAMVPVCNHQHYLLTEVDGYLAVRNARRQCMLEVRKLLAGWSPDTPFHGFPCDQFEAQPVFIRRGPMTKAELPKGMSSRGLPLVATYVDGRVTERHDELVTWDDEASREAARQRQISGRGHRKAEVTAVFRYLEEIACLVPLINKGKGRLSPADCQIPGMTHPVRIVGPVRMGGRSRKLPQVLVHNKPGADPSSADRRTYWIAAELFKTVEM